MLYRRLRRPVNGRALSDGEAFLPEDSRASVVRYTLVSRSDDHSWSRPTRLSGLSPGVAAGPQGPHSLRRATGRRCLGVRGRGSLPLSMGMNAVSVPRPRFGATARNGFRFGTCFPCLLRRRRPRRPTWRSLRHLGSMLQLQALPDHESPGAVWRPLVLGRARQR